MLDSNLPNLISHLLIELKKTYLKVRTSTPRFATDA